jgi:peptidyl-prolyl cis-trans isomerase SurA
VRYGQAPRETLPNAVVPTATEAGSAANSNTSLMQQALPEQESTSNAPNPLEAQAKPKGKTRYAARPVEKKAKKAKAKAAPAAAPAPSDQETVTQQVQSAPLGLAGDTAKKKQQHQKGSFFKPKKKRLENATAPKTSGQAAGTQQQPAGTGQQPAPTPAPTSAPAGSNKQ